ncbi:hypothetical protein [Lentzea sp. NPDC004782]
MVQFVRGAQQRGDALRGVLSLMADRLQHLDLRIPSRSRSFR